MYEKFVTCERSRLSSEIFRFSPCNITKSTTAYLYEVLTGQVLASHMIEPLSENQTSLVPAQSTLPTHWVQSTLGVIADVIGGSTPPRNDASNFGGDIVWLTPTEIPKHGVTTISDSREHLSQKGFESGGIRLIPKGSVLLTSRASIGYVAIAGTDVTTNQGFASFIISEGLHPQFLGWWLFAQKDKLTDRAKGTTFKEISKSEIKTIVFPLAPFNEQKRIAEKLDELFSQLDAGLETLQLARARVKAYRTATLTEATTGELSASWRAERSAANETFEDAQVLLARILDERRARWEDEQRAKRATKTNSQKTLIEDESWKTKYPAPAAPDTSTLPDLPDGWCWASLEQLSTDIVDCLHSTPKFVSEGEFCIDTTCIKPGHIRFEQARFVSKDIFQDRIRRMKPEGGDILFAREGTIGTAVVVPPNIDLCLGQRMMMFRPHKQMSSKYFMWALNSKSFQQQWMPKVVGTTAPHVNIRDLRLMSIPFPPLDEQEFIVTEVEQRLSIAARSAISLDDNEKRVIALRQTILQQAFAGELVPPDPDDEPAQVLLERIRAVRAAAQVQAKQEKQRRPRPKRKTMKKTSERKPLSVALNEAGGRLTPEELFSAAGFNWESVDEFYSELREQIGHTITQERPNETDVFIVSLSQNVSSGDVS